MHICNGSATKSVGLLSKLSSVLVQPCSHCCWNYGRPRSDDQSYNDNLGQTNLWNYAVPESIAWLTHVEANVTSSLDGQVSQSEPHTVRTVVAMAVPKDTHATWLSWWQWVNWFDSMLLPAVAGTWHAAWGCKHFARVFNLWLCPELGDSGIPQNGNFYADNDDQPWDLWVLNFPTNLLNKETVKAQGHSFRQASKGKFWRTSFGLQ